MSMSQLEFGKIALLGLVVAAGIWFVTSPVTFKSANTGAKVLALKSAKATDQGAGKSAAAIQAESVAYSDWDYIDGMKHMAAKRYNEAVESFSRATASQKRNSYAWYQRSLALLAVKRNDEAIADVTKAIELNPANADFYFARADAYSRTKQYAAGIADCRFVVKEIGDSKEAQQNLARIYIDEKEYKAAIVSLARAEELCAQDAGTLNLLGICHANLGLVDQAIADYTKAIERDSHSDSSFTNRGLIYLERKEYQKAVADFDSVVRCGKEDAMTYYNRSRAYEALGKKALAKADLTRAKQLGYDPAKGAPG